MSADNISTEDFYTPNPNLYAGRVRTPMISAGVMLLALILAPFVLSILFVFLMLFSIESQNTDGPAPNANFATRRQWGEEKLKHHFRAAEKWLRTSTQIAKDIGSINGVAPIGSPNSFGAGFGESWAEMNLEVIGDRGEGVLYLPDFCADDSRQTYGFDTASWIFEDHRYPVLPSGESWLEEHGLDSLYNQIFVFADQQDHHNAVKTCRELEQKVQALVAKGTLLRRGGNVFSSFPRVYRAKLLKQFSDSLVESSKDNSIPTASQSDHVPD